MNGLVSELSELAGRERAMLNECEALLSSTSTMQVRISIFLDKLHFVKLLSNIQLFERKKDDTNMLFYSHACNNALFIPGNYLMSYSYPDFFLLF